MTALQITIPKLACSFCVKVATKAAKTVEAVATIQADTKTKLVNVETRTPVAVIKKALAVAGYPTT